MQISYSTYKNVFGWSGMPSDTITIAGFELIEQRPTHDAGIEHWIAKGMGRSADVYTLPLEYRERLSGLPNIVGFTPLRLLEENNQLIVVMPGRIEVSVVQLRKKFGAEVCVGIFWHIADLLGLLHQSGRAHNLLHVDCIGLNDLGELEIRPALGQFIVSDPDSKATAIATDCWQLGPIMRQLGIDESMDPLFGLLKRGLQEEYARLRLQPATAVRQSISAVWARHPEWESKFIEAMGESWVLNQRSLEESTVLPHRLTDLRPKMSINDIRDLPESIDLWGNLFNSSSIDEASSSQALLMEALSARKKSKREPNTRIVLPSHKDREEVMEDSTATLQIELKASPIQVSVQQTASRLNSGLVSIQEVGLEDEVSPALPDDEDRYFQGLASIVEETAENLEVLHQKRRRSLSKSAPQPSPILPPPIVEISPKESLHRIVEEHEIKNSPTGRMVIMEIDETEDVGGQQVDFSEHISEHIDPSDDVDLSTRVNQEVNEKVEDLIDVKTEPSSTVLEQVEQTVVDVHSPRESLVEDTDLESSQAEVTPSVVEEMADGLLEGSDALMTEQVHDWSEDQNEHSVVEAVVDSQVAKQVDAGIEGHAEGPANDELSNAFSLVDEQSVEQTETNVENVEVVAVDAVEVDSFKPDVFEPDAFEPDAFELGAVELTETLSDSPLTEEGLEPNTDQQAATEVDVEIVATASVSMNEVSTLDRLEDEPISEGGAPVQGVSIGNMPLISIVEEYSEDEATGTLQEDVHTVEESGARIELLMEEPAIEVSDEGLDAVFEPEGDMSTSSVSNSVESFSEERGFIADLSETVQPMGQSPMGQSKDELDVEEPLADIEFPSIEEVKAKDSAFGGDVNALFDTNPVVQTRSEPTLDTPKGAVREAVMSADTKPEPMVSAEPMEPRNAVSAGMEPKWTGASAFDNLSNEEDALGDEKYAFDQVELGDVDAVLGESIRDISDLEKRGSPIGLLLIVGLVLIFGIVYLLNPQDTVEPVVNATGVNGVNNVTEAQNIEAAGTQGNVVKIQTNPPQGRVYIENQELGVAPLEWEMTEGDRFMMCVDWGSNPICRRISRTDFGTEYTFVRKQTP